MKKKFLFVLLIVFAISASLFVGCGKVEFKLNFVVDEEVYATISTNGKEAVKLPDNPEKVGYVFDGWYWDNEVWKRPFTANSLLDTPLSSDMSVYAKFEKEEAVKGTQAEFVGFEKIDENKYLKKVSNDTEILSLDTLVKVNSKSNWIASYDISCTKVILSKIVELTAGDNLCYINVTDENGNMSLYTLNIRRREIYEVSFADSDVQSQYIEEDSCAVAPATANRNGYIFESWNFDFSMPIVENTVITAKWNVITYNIEYELNGGENNSANPTTYNIESEEIVLQTPSKIGYDFVGWYEDKAFIEKIEKVVTGSYGDKKFYAKWNITTYNIEYELNGTENNSTNPTTYTIESEEIVLQTPSKTGYDFVGWYANEDLTEKVEKIVAGTYGNKKFYAKWQVIVYSITYELNGGENNSLNPTTYTIESEEIVLQDPIKTGYSFVKWYVSDPINEYIDKITTGSYGNKKFYAHWMQNVYKIEYELNGGKNNSLNPTTYTIESNDIVLRSPSKAGYDFVGWYTDEDLIGKVEKISTGSYGNRKFYAKWTPTVYSITYELNGGENNSLNPTTYTIESEDIVLQTPTIQSEDYDGFIGWFSDKELRYKAQSIKQGSYGNKTFYAKWSSKYYLFDTRTKTIMGLTDYGKTCPSLVIPKQITGIDVSAIGNNAFFDCSKLENIAIPDSVTSIGWAAFECCTGLTSVTIGNGVTSIDGFAFVGCTGLTSITIPNSVTSIESYAFMGCTGLTSIIIPKSVTSIGDSAFADCTGLKTIYYKGTEKQWNTITKGSYWDHNTGNYTIVYNA